MEAFIIDNCVVSKIQNGICVRKLRPGRNIDLPVISTGNRVEDNRLIHQLINGQITFDQAIQIGV